MEKVIYKDSKPTAFVLVGHEDWGKSETLKYLMDGSTHKGWATICGRRIRVRRCSNDDPSRRYNDDGTRAVLAFLDMCIKKSYNILVFTLCPKFNTASRGTERILNKAKANYDLRFFVLHKCYGKERRIPERELVSLRQFGCCEVHTTSEEAKYRARDFGRYISGVLGGAPKADTSMR